MIPMVTYTFLWCTEVSFSEDFGTVEVFVMYYHMLQMWALSPSIFDLLAHRLLPSKPSVCDVLPCVTDVGPVSQYL